MKHHNVTETVSKIVLGFLKNPFYAHNKFVSFSLLGPPGTGKSTLAVQIARVFEKAGLFEKGYQDKDKTAFIGQFLGQTPHITKNTLVSHALDGVLLVDETYNLCNLEGNKDPPVVDMYGQEFATALVDFMTRYKGMYCIITAGYEDKMNERFFAANEGLDRRFPHRFSLGNIGVDNLVSIIVNHIVKGFGYKDKKEWESANSSKESIFDKEAFGFLKTMLSGIKQKIGTSLLGELLANAAGSATNIAEFILTEVVVDIPSTLEGCMRSTPVAPEAQLKKALVPGYIKRRHIESGMQSLVQQKFTGSDVRTVYREMDLIFVKNSRRR